MEIVSPIRESPSVLCFDIIFLCELCIKAVVISEIEKPGIELNDRQKKGLRYASIEEFISNQIHREINKVLDETSIRELSQLVEKRLLKIKGKGRSIKYVPVIGDLRTSRKPMNLSL